MSPNLPAATRKSIRGLHLAKRNEALMELRLAGKSYAEIGDILGLTPRSVETQHSKLLAEAVARCSENVEEERAIIRLRYDAMIHAWWDRAKEDPKAAGVVEHYLKGLRELTGADVQQVAPPILIAPVQINVVETGANVIVTAPQAPDPENTIIDGDIADDYSSDDLTDGLAVTRLGEPISPSPC